MIIPCFNAEKYLSECLDSVISQTHLDLQIICIDDGSTDLTGVILKQYQQKDSRINVLTSHNQGAPAARNLGLSVAEGVFIQFLDADDILVGEKIEKQLAFFMKDVDIVVSDWIRMDENLETTLERNTFEDIGSNPLSVAIRKIITTANPLYRKSAVIGIGGYSCDLTAAQDWDFHIRLVLEGYSICYAPGFLFISRKVPGSISSNWIKVCFQACKVIKRFKNKIRNSGLYNNDIQNHICILYYNAAIFSKNKICLNKYIKELIYWSNGPRKYLNNRIKVAFASVIGVEYFIKFERFVKFRRI